jgi:hypothetical protein
MWSPDVSHRRENEMVSFTVGEKSRCPSIWQRSISAAISFAFVAINAALSLAKRNAFLSLAAALPEYAIISSPLITPSGDTCAFMLILV